MGEEKTGVEYRAMCKDGVIVKIYKEKGLHRAFNSAGVQVGLPFVELGNLLKDIGAELVGAPPQSPGWRDKAEGEMMEPEAASDYDTLKEKTPAETGGFRQEPEPENPGEGIPSGTAGAPLT